MHSILTLTYFFNQLTSQADHYSYTNPGKASSNVDSSWLLYWQMDYVKIK
ncbi:hypothetical protein [Paenibacillus illinoisensis]|nr:hypothetical protein [Paenibacillus illinoisensis]